MTFYPLAFSVLAALFFLLAFKFHKLGQETTKLHYQRDVLYEHLYPFYPQYKELPDELNEVLDEIEGK